MFSDIDMKKDIEVLIAEERAQIISKYDKVRNCTDFNQDFKDMLYFVWSFTKIL